jgi:hypothetical protein
MTKKKKNLTDKIKEILSNTPEEPVRDPWVNPWMDPHNIPGIPVRTDDFQDICGICEPNEPIKRYGEATPTVEIGPFPYHFNEGNILKEIEDYIQSTYGQHYVGLGDGKQTQVMDLLMANQPTGLEFSRGAVIKYATRFGKKSGNNRKDLLKAAHYIIFMLKSASDMENSVNEAE